MNTSYTFLRFIQLLHDYRIRKVNPAHLELEELFNPQKLYNYLRNHHWKEGIPQDFIESLAQMNISNYKLNDSDKLDFKIILKKLGIQLNMKLLSPSEPEPYKINIIKRTPETISSINKNWKEYKQWVISRIFDIEQIVDRYLVIDTKNSENTANLALKLDLLREISELQHILDIGNEKQTGEMQEQIRAETKESGNETLLVDIANILYADMNAIGLLKVKNIMNVITTLTQKYHFNPLLIADASIKHKMDDKELYEYYKSEDYITVAPADRPADIYILKLAKSRNYKFLTNDLFHEYWTEFGEEWIKQNRITYKLFDGELIID